MKRLTNEQTDKFVAFLEGQWGPAGRANLAELRRAATDPLRDYRDVRILGDHLPDDEWSFDAYRLTATLFALYATKFWDKGGRLNLPRFDPNEKRRSLGASLRRLRYQLSAGQDSLDLRFSALLDTPREDLAVPLRGIMQRVATADKRIPIDFRRLLNDLIYWNADEPGRPSVRRIWARDYWQATIAEEDTETVSEIPNANSTSQI